MTKILSVATHATDDPTKASLAFIAAAGAHDAGTEVAIALLGEASYLAIPSIRSNVHGVGFPPLSDLATTIVKAGVPVYV